MRILPLALTIAASTAAAETCSRDAMLVFDGSGSMLETGFDTTGRPKIEEARLAVAQAAPQITKTRALGLITYGPGGADACSGIALNFAPRAQAALDLVAAVDALEPAGNTPLTASVAMAAQVLEGPGVVVLVTDGQETCEGAPCALAAFLAQDAGLTVHVIGFKVRGAFFEWQSLDPDDFFVTEPAARCLADETGGLYLPAQDVDELVAALQETLGCALLF